MAAARTARSPAPSKTIGRNSHLRPLESSVNGPRLIIFRIIALHHKPSPISEYLCQKSTLLVRGKPGLRKKKRDNSLQANLPSNQS